ncbi:unnamed protein product [Caenorhabditis bovis]|uniref:Uncharacterized protein n=1 Tax=Caenorhabditis bovis TaxID=2654633 RepID=A0A8S1ER85_9PELO|nr:unnamed protein product [Caenorhabditis bovis]
MAQLRRSARLAAIPKTPPKPAEVKIKSPLIPSPYFRRAMLAAAPPRIAPIYNYNKLTIHDPMRSSLGGFNENRRVPFLDKLRPLHEILALYEVKQEPEEPAAPPQPTKRQMTKDELKKVLEYMAKAPVRSFVYTRLFLRELFGDDKENVFINPILSNLWVFLKSESPDVRLIPSDLVFDDHGIETLLVYRVMNTMNGSFGNAYDDKKIYKDSARLTIRRAELVERYYNELVRNNVVIFGLHIKNDDLKMLKKLWEQCANAQFAL